MTSSGVGLGDGEAHAAGEKGVVEFQTVYASFRGTVLREVDGRGLFGGEGAVELTGGN